MAVNRDNYRMIYWLGVQHLHESIARHLNNGKLDITEIVMDNFVPEHRRNAMHWVPRGYSVVFKAYGRHKIMQYNT